MSTMLRKCKCGCEYGRFRDQCPACGTPTPYREHARYVEPKPDTRTRREVTRRVKQIVKANSCIFCQRVANKAVTCPHCDERIHEACLALHRNDCRKFQLEREQLVAAR